MSSYIECGDKATNAHACLLPFQVEFSLFLTPAELGDRHRCWQLFTERVKDIANVIMSQPLDSSTKHYHDAIRYQRLTGRH